MKTDAQTHVMLVTDRGDPVVSLDRLREICYDLGGRSWESPEPGAGWAETLGYAARCDPFSLRILQVAAMESIGTDRVLAIRDV